MQYVTLGAKCPYTTCHDRTRESMRAANRRSSQADDLRVPLNASFSDPGVCDVLFADDRILLGRTRDGRLLVLDLADPSVRPTELKVDSPIVSLSAVPLSVSYWLKGDCEV